MLDAMHICGNSKENDVSEHKTNPVCESREIVSKEYAESYVWWSEFLTARTNAIDAMLQLGKPVSEIRRVLSLEDEEHLLRINILNKLIGE